MKTRFLLTLSCLAVAYSYSGCASTSANGEPKARVETVPYRMQPLDALVLRSPEGGAATVALDAEGKAALPNNDGHDLLLLDVPIDEARASVEKAWKGARVLRVVQFQTPRISLVGEVQRPANLPLADTPMRVMDAISAAGGFTTMANVSRVTVLRKNADQVQIFRLDLSTVMKGRGLGQNILLEAGDVVTVGRTLF